MPGSPRCKSCYVPFEGLGSRLARLVYGKRPSNLNPQMCNECEKFARQFQGGAEVELTLLFADVRGSTALAEKMSPREFGRLINRFYTAASHVMVHSDALIDKIIGDQVAGMYVPGFAGPDHARVAVEAAHELLEVTGHGRADGPWMPLGIGVHTGIAFVGSVGSQESTTDITVLGDVANTTARLSSTAGPGEIFVSEAAYAQVGSGFASEERRELQLKGKRDVFTVHVLAPYAARPGAATTPSTS